MQSQQNVHVKSEVMPIANDFVYDITMVQP